MEPERTPKQTDLVTQDVNSLTEVAPSSLHSQPPVPDAIPSSGPRFEDKLVEGKRAVYGGPRVQCVYHVPTVLPKAKSVQSGRTRLLQAPVSDGDANYMSLEVDEIAALQDVVKRVQSVKGSANTVDNPAYSLYGYPFKSKYDVYKAHYENGFLKFVSLFDEPPMATLSESESADLICLEKIDGTTDTKEIMREMKHMD